MSVETVRNYLKQFGAEDRILEFDVSSATVELAARALDCAPALIAKSMGFYGADGPVLIVTAGDTKIDNHKFRETFHVKAKMLSHEDTSLLTGHAPGGVCPFAVKEGVKCYLDESLKRFEKVYPACGSSNSAIGVTVTELEKFCSPPALWVDVTKPKE